MADQTVLIFTDDGKPRVPFIDMALPMTIWNRIKVSLACAALDS